VSGIYHSTSADGYQLRIANLVVKNNTTKQGQKYGRVLPCSISPSINNTLHVNTSHANKIKQTMLD
jgi:hypothetical protein